MLVGAVKGALIGAVSGAITGAVMGAITEGIKTGTWEGAWKGAISGAIEGAADGFMWGAIGGAISGAMNPKYCFVAGTLVMTKQGLKAIEEIQVGDQVMSYNDNLDIFEYKDVVDVYINETSEICHVHTENEKITCTPNHNILTNNGWKPASDLKANDLIKTSKGVVKVLFVDIIELKEQINVYNLNVLGYHTYVIGSELLIVHNKCGGSNIDDGVQICDNSHVPNKGGPGQKHHAISNKAYRKLEKKPWWGSRTRDSYQMQALTKEGHRGYQRWHRKLDSLLVDAVDSSSCLVDFQNKINAIYQTPEIVNIFGKIKIIL